MLDIHQTKPADWEEQCKENNLYFFSCGWGKVINYLGVKSNFFITHKGQPVSVLTIFSRYGFSAAYLNFPIGEFHEQKEPVVEFLKNRTFKNVDTIRIDYIASKVSDTDTNTLPRTMITDLAIWSENELPSSVRRNINKARNSNVSIKPANDKDLDDVFSLYSGTINRHNGNLRYKKEYFSELIKESLETSKLNIFLAKLDEKNIGFLVVGIHGTCAYYLHGGINIEYSQCRAMDYLFLHSIKRAKEENLLRYDFLASPREQSGLVKFKEKWGAKTLAQKRMNLYSCAPKGSLMKLMSI